MRMNTHIDQAWQSITSRRCLSTLVLLTLAFCATANQVVYKCGQEITNQPTDLKQCQPLNISQPTQIDGTRVQTSYHKVTGTAVMDASVVQAVPSVESLERKAQARTILEDEWQKLSAQYAELVQQYNRAKPTTVSAETIHHANDPQRAMALKAQVQRVERDLQALQRELKRYGVQMASPVSAATSK